MKKAFNRLLALLLTMLLVVNASGITVFAADTGNELPAGLTPEEQLQWEKQINDGWLKADDDGELGKEISDGEWNKTKLGKVQVSKTIAPTGIENEFEITLEVVTKENLKEKIYAPDAAVTLVMDVSASMSQCAICGKGYHEYIDHDFIDDGPKDDDVLYNLSLQNGGKPEDYYYSVKNDDSCDYAESIYGEGYYEYCGLTEDGHQKHAFKERIEAAKESALSFIENLRKNTPKDENGDYLAHRWVSLVSFSGHAQEACEWTDITTDTGYKKLLASINGMQPNLNDRVNENDETIDEGGTNICEGLQKAAEEMKGSVTKNEESISVQSIDNRYTVLLSDGMPSFYMDENGNRVGNGWEEFTTKDYCDATKEYAEKLHDLSDLYSICFCEARKVCYNDPATGDVKVEDLLRSMSDKTYTADDADGLQTAFDHISELLKFLTEAWIVTDPMGDLIVNNGVLKDEDGGIQRVEVDGNTIYWNLQKDTPIDTTVEGNETVYTYQLKYSITLDNLQDRFIEGKYYATNGYTDLTYVFRNEKNELTDENGNVLDGDELKPFSIGFNVPQVKGYLGDLTFKKVGPSGEAIEGAVFTLTLTGEDGVWTATATSGSDGTVTFENIPSGHEYTLTETTAPTGYERVGDMTVVVSYGEVTVTVDGEGVAKDDSGVYTVTDPYTVGSLKITKNVKVDEKGKIDDIIGENGREFKFTVQADKNLKGKFGKINGEDVEFKDGKAEVTVTVTVGEDGNASGDVTIEDLPVGTYTVTEDKQDAAVEGYTLEVTGGGSVTVAANENGEPSTVTVTNTYTQKLGSLKITKTVDGGPADASTTKEYTFTVTGPSYPEGHEVKINGSGSATIEGLVPGTYTVTEQDANIDGYTLKVTGDTTATVVADETATATITNKYTQKLGSLTITKMVDGGGEEAANKTYTFTVTGPNYANTVTLTAGASTTINDLVPGTYTITETDAEIEGYTLKTTGTGDVEVKDKTNTNRTVTNTYTQKLGSLKITKMVSGGGAEAAGKTYTFTIEGPEGSNYFETVTLTAGASETLEGLVPGTYTVTEQDANIDGYTLEVDGTGDVTVEADGNVEVTVTNTYTTVETNPVETDPVETDPVETDPVETDPVETDPVETEPEETEPVETEPEETEPEETEPVETEPVETEPEETEPVETEPEETEPEETEPVETEPVETEPVETEPEETEPVETEPEETEPVETEPVETEPVETEPVETEPEETEPVETDPVETEPEPETEPVIIPETTGPEPVVTEPVETEPVVTEPAETEPETEIPEPDVPLDDISNEPAPAADVPSTEPPYEEIPDPDVPLVDIPDQFVPMTDIPSIEPPYEDIPDADIPLAEEAIPTTGDISRRSLWTGLMSISGLGIMGMIAAILADRKKSKKEDKD